MLFETRSKPVGMILFFVGLFLFLTVFPQLHHDASAKPADKVKLCHEGKVIEVSENAVPAHLKNHGDCLAPEEAAKGAPCDCEDNDTGCVSPPSGLISWWPLDGNPQDIQQQNTGILEGAGGQFVSGKVNLGFQSGGQGSLIAVSDAPTLDVTEFTIDAWVRVDGINLKNMVIVWKGDSGGQNVTSPYSILVIGTGVEVAGEFNSGTPAAGKVRVLLTDGVSIGHNIISNAVLPIGTFTHIAVTIDGVNVQIYIDGQLDTNVGQVFTPFNSAFPLQIGSISNAVAANFFNGIIDEVELYNRDLSASEIQSIFNAGSAGKCKPAAAPPLNPRRKLTTTWGAIKSKY